MKFIALLLLCSNIALADNVTVSVFLTKGQASPYDGYLLDQAKVKSLYNDNLDLQFYKKSNDNLNLQIVDYDKRVNNCLSQNDKLAVKLEHSDSNMLEKIGFFFLGAAAASIVAFGAARAVR